MDDNAVNDLAERQWTMEEKWTLIWSTEYAKCKFKKAAERCAEWQRIFFYHCPDKLEVTPRRITIRESLIKSLLNTPEN